MTGMAVVFGATLGIGPATASTSVTTAAASSTQGAQDQSVAPRHRIHDYYRSYWQCRRAGERGEDRRWWDDYDCYRVHWGRWRGWWALDVRWDRDRDHNNNNNNNDHRDNNDNNRDHRDRDHRDRG
jgi:hypothetical protein